MCGIFGIVSDRWVPRALFARLARHSERRGRDASGLLVYRAGSYQVVRANRTIRNLLRTSPIGRTSFAMGHSRLITNGLEDNQPVLRDAICLIHNGIIVNDDALWRRVTRSRLQGIDSEIIAAIAADTVDSGAGMQEIADRVLERCDGVVACALASLRRGKLLLFSNNGSLYVGKNDGSTCFASEQYTLIESGCTDVRQVRQRAVIIDIPESADDPVVTEDRSRTRNLIPSLGTQRGEERLLVYSDCTAPRCTRCILPATVPYIKFDSSGICNFCHNYKLRNRQRPLDELVSLVEPYRRTHGEDCIVPFSGGRDSCYGLHLICKELGMKPIAYTYDWGMVTDLGRRNISRMCARLGVENIIVADDIWRKRLNIATNLRAWLDAPDLGMVSILTAGDKHFFRHVETVKRQTGISLNFWGVNPLEVTHFKAGFLGVPPDFDEKRVYNSGVGKQIRYQWLRLKAMMNSPGYFNRSLWDTLSGEYYRSFAKKTDYFHIYDYWRWDEQVIDEVLEREYRWERAPDTRTTWRIGDGTAAFYNYIYRTVAGFTEHDTFRSNQIREGDLTRERALQLVEEENQPRYPNIKWYLDAIGMDFKATIEVINAIPRLYHG